MGSTASNNEIIETLKDKFTYLTMNNEFNDKKSTRKMSAELAEFKAQQLIDKYNSPQSRNFFLKCIYHLSEADIQNAVELSQQKWVKSPIKYFVKISYAKLNG